MVDRKKVFVDKVNDLSTKYQYSYAFRKELTSSSILNVVHNDHNNIITEHFKKMFNEQHDMTKGTPKITKKSMITNWRLTHITANELGKIIRSTKNSMAGYDNISVPLLKALNTQALQFITNAINLAITSQSIPKELGIGILLPLPKKNSPKQLSDFRPIVVLSSLYRLFSTVINKQFMDILAKANLIHPAQRGFMKKGSTVEHLLTLRTLMASKFEQRKELFVLA